MDEGLANIGLNFNKETKLKHGRLRTPAVTMPILTEATTITKEHVKQFEEGPAPVSSGVSLGW